MFDWLTSYLPSFKPPESPSTPLLPPDGGLPPTPSLEIHHKATSSDSSDTPLTFTGKLAATFDSVFGPSLTGGRSAARLGDLSSGLGIPGRDPFYSQFWSSGTLSSGSVQEIDALKRDGLVRKIIGSPWSDALRAGFDIRGMAPPLQDLIQFHLRRLHTSQQLWQLNFLRDIWGEAILTIGANDFPQAFADPTQDLDHFTTELNLQMLAKNQEILWLRPFGKKSAYGRESGFIPRVQADVRSPLFGNPLYFEISNFWAPAKPGYTDLDAPLHSGSLIVHNSRVLHATTPDALSRLVEIDPYLKAYQGGLASLGQLLRTSSISFIKISNWLHKTRNNRDESHARLALAALSMSALGSIFLDKDYEDHEFQSRPLSGASDILASLQEALSGASSTPMAILFGTEPRGFASAEEVTERYYTGVVERQQAVLTPQYEKLIQLILTAYVSPHEQPKPNSWSIEWRPLRMPNELEKAKIRKATFDALKVENEAIKAGIGVPGALSAKEIRSTQGADRFSVDPVLDPLIPTTKSVPLSSPSPISAQPSANEGEVPPLDPSEADLMKQETLDQQAKLLDEIRAMGDELKTTDALAEELNLPENYVSRVIKANPGIRRMKGYGKRGKTAYSRNDIISALNSHLEIQSFSAMPANEVTSNAQVSEDPLVHFHTARQSNPSSFEGIKVLKTAKNGVQLRGGRNKKTGKVEVQSVWIPSTIDAGKAKKWLLRNDFSIAQFEEARER